MTRFAAVDLGSNSFHLVIARSDGGTLQVLDRYKESVRLGEGLTDDKRLTPEVEQRALACLERMGQQLRDMRSSRVRIVGTNTLRQLRRDSRFIERAELALGHSVEVIAGREEARLIYLGVAHGLAIGDEKRLVVDIGGGSTELIVGQGFTPLLRESLHIGCVSLTRRFFANDRITARAMEKAELNCALELRPVRELFRQSGWHTATGSSGTIRAIAAVLAAEGWSNDDDSINAEGLLRLREAMINTGRVSAIHFKGLTEDRRPVFAGGVAVLRAIFLNLDIKRMRVSDQALREGLLYEMLGRIQHEDVRERTVMTFCRRFDVDKDHAERVSQTALALFAQLRLPWQLNDPNAPKLLSWAAHLHEIGLAVAHSQYQKHGAYLLSHADLSGFTRSEQDVLATLVLGHRRKLPMDTFMSLSGTARECTRHLCVILRLAVLIHRGRSASAKPTPEVIAQNEHLTLMFPTGWLATHPLTRLELEEEAQRLITAGINLEFF
ncbi:Ppx/GppA family phosphatase [Thiospirillum jenense]|uniref:Ppx/GppA family phosphatase n=1 Tax=Thiospirillum jenense TaxID=1653858 RepID=A0A839HCV2_9GAMM|nr:Ppx/GppA family phosphatase [Thiospirillum jenense]